MGRFNKAYIKKLYMPDGKDKSQLDKMTQVTATATQLNQLYTGTLSVSTFTVTGASTLTGAVTASGGIDLSGHTSTTASNIILGGVGRISTGSFAGAELTVPSTATQNEGIYCKYGITGFSGSDFTGLYMRAEAKTNAATAKSLYGAQIWGVNNAVTQTTGSLWGQLTYAYIKGATAVTINNVYAIQAEISMDASRSANATITTEAAMILAKLTAGDLADDTKVHGMIIRVGDMDGDAATFGNGILIEDDAAMSGACGFTKGINITAPCVNSIYINNTMASTTAGSYGIYCKSNVESFAGSEFIGLYARAEAKTNAATAKSLYGSMIYGTCNNVTQTSGSLWGTLTYAYIKGADAVTINNVYAGQFEISMDAGRSADATITTEAACILAKVTAGDLADETKVHGIIIRVGDMDGDSEAFGSAIKVVDDASMSGTCTFTSGLELAISGTNALQILGTWTNFLDLPAAGTGFVITNALVPAAAPDAGTMGADAALTCDINGTPYYIPLYDTLHA